MPLSIFRIAQNSSPFLSRTGRAVTTLGHMTIYRYQPEAFHRTSARRFGRLAKAAIENSVWRRSVLLVPRKRLTDVGIKRRNKMLGLGVLGTIIVICLVVWLVRRVV